MRVSLFRRLLGSGVVLLLAAGWSAETSAQQASPQVVPQVQAPPPQQVPPHGTPPDFVEVSKPLIPAVVNVSSSRPPQRQPPPPGRTLPQLPPPFDELFPEAPPGDGQDGARRGSQALGSGFLIDASGYVVTNNHVVEGAESISLILHDEWVISSRAASCMGTVLAWG
ncbi:MAG: hypothetical protein K2Q10_07135 [Rhodospirillales bacterium]|nr:hypothetical protein [Rhodospirillales bacterium]